MHRNPLAVALVLVFAATTSLGASEPAAEVPAATRDLVLAAIESYVEWDVERKGAFLVLDPRTDEPLALIFDHVHQGVKPAGDGYLACVDFANAEGIVHDVDVVVDASGPEPRVTEVFLHKVDGEKVTAEPQ